MTTLADNGVRTKMALDAMKFEAELLGVQGVATISLIRADEPNYVESRQLKVGRAFRAPDPATRGENDPGRNYWIGSYAKNGESMRTELPSGTSQDSLLGCEFGMPGNVVAEHNGYKLFFAFSGGTSAQDKHIAEIGRKVFME